MSAKISQFDRLFNLTGDEEFLIAYSGSNWKVAARDVIRLVDKTLLGLDQVDNTPDISKPVSNAVQSALGQKAALAHGHELGDINGLPTALAQINSGIQGLNLGLSTKADASHLHSMDAVTGLAAEFAKKSNTGHGHAIADVAGLQTALNDITLGLAGKALTAHIHAITDVTGLSTALAGKATSTHTHAVADITNFTTTVTTMITAAKVSDVLSGTHQW